MPVLMPEMVQPLLSAGASCRVDTQVPARFHAGDTVRARNLNPTGHTRLPRYIRGHHGVVQCDHGVFAFPDSNAHGQGLQPQHVYSVRFEGRELWGPQGGTHDALYVDLFDDYLEAG